MPYLPLSVLGFQKSFAKPRCTANSYPNPPRAAFQGKVVDILSRTNFSIIPLEDETFRLKVESYRKFDFLFTVFKLRA